MPLKSFVEVKHDILVFIVSHHNLSCLLYFLILQLGFAEPLEESQPPLLFLNANWHDWDGGKIGKQEPVCCTCASP
jgi:hypothetical protein